MYQVPDAQLGEGRVVRCVRCATDWSPVVSVPADDAAPPPREAPPPAPDAPSGSMPEPMSEPGPEPVSEPGPERRMALDDDAVLPVVPVVAVPKAAVAVERRRSPWLAVAWVASVLAVAGGVAAAAVWRERVMQAWPPSIRAYAALGLTGRP